MDKDLFQMLVGLQASVQTFQQSVPTLQDDVKLLAEKIHEVEVLVARITGSQEQIVNQINGVNANVAAVIAGLQGSNIDFEIAGNVDTIKNEEKHG